MELIGAERQQMVDNLRRPEPALWLDKRIQVDKRETCLQL